MASSYGNQRLWAYVQLMKQSHPNSQLRLLAPLTKHPATSGDRTSSPTAADELVAQCDSGGPTGAMKFADVGGVDPGSCSCSL